MYATIGTVLRGANPNEGSSGSPTIPMWSQIQEIIGDLDDLETEAKNNLVSAINEAAKSGGVGCDCTSATDDEIIDALYETGIISPITDSDCKIFLVDDNNILTL